MKVNLQQGWLVIDIATYRNSDGRTHVDQDPPSDAWKDSSAPGIFSCCMRARPKAEAAQSASAFHSSLLRGDPPPTKLDSVTQGKLGWHGPHRSFDRVTGLRNRSPLQSHQDPVSDLRCQDRYTREASLAPFARPMIAPLHTRGGKEGDCVQITVGWRATHAVSSCPPYQPTRA